ncbi:MAG TPA: transcriptional regulator [Rhizobiaceae bacterium]|nr:transcriptional regulator [Rhizobiaceae bacterium]
MTRTKSEAERARTQYAALASHYRAIGPAAIVAALLHTKKRKAAKPSKTA